MLVQRPTTIIVGLDGSPASRGAFEQALVLAGSMRGRLVAVAVVPGLGGLERIGRERERRELVRPYEEALAEAGEAAANAGLPLKKVLETGEVFERLVDVAEGEDASLMTSHQLGLVAHLGGELEEAKSWYIRAITLFERMDDTGNADKTKKLLDYVTDFERKGSHEGHGRLFARSFARCGRQRHGGTDP